MDSFIFQAPGQFVENCCCFIHWAIFRKLSHTGRQQIKISSVVNSIACSLIIVPIEIWICNDVQRAEKGSKKSYLLDGYQPRTMQDLI